MFLFLFYSKYFIFFFRKEECKKIFSNQIEKKHVINMIKNLKKYMSRIEIMSDPDNRVKIGAITCDLIKQNKKQEKLSLVSF